MASIDQFLDRVPRPGYNCFDFACEVWQYLYGEDLHDRLHKLTGSFDKRRISVAGRKAFKLLPKPVEPCLVVMKRFKFDPHIGIYLDRRVLHMKESGVEFQPLLVSKLLFKTIVYYQ